MGQNLSFYCRTWRDESRVRHHIYCLPILVSSRVWADTHRHLFWLRITVDYRGCR